MCRLLLQYLLLIGGWLEGVWYRDLDVSVEEFLVDAVNDTHQPRSGIREVGTESREATYSVVLLHPLEDDKGRVGIESVGVILLSNGHCS